jgi:hypothetical protein
LTMFTSPLFLIAELAVAVVYLLRRRRWVLAVLPLPAIWVLIGVLAHLIEYFYYFGRTFYLKQIAWWWDPISPWTVLGILVP